MLVVTRKPGESLIIGNVTVHFLERNGIGIRVGIEAPPAVRIMRTELLGEVMAGPCLIEVESSRDSIEAKY